MGPATRAWRVKERGRLKRARQALSSTERRFLTDAVARNLDTLFERLPCRTLGIYWPIRGELDLRAWAESLSKRKKCGLALPVVVREQSPLEYWHWRQGDEMGRGFWGIMVPKHASPVTPDAVIAPLVGFSGRYRLGHGGGYFDRTLAVMRPRPRAIGVGAEAGRLRGYIPQAHDMPMDVIVTEAAIHREPTVAEAGDEHQ